MFYPSLSCLYTIRSPAIGNFVTFTEPGTNYSHICSAITSTTITTSSIASARNVSTATIGLGFLLNQLPIIVI